MQLLGHLPDLYGEFRLGSFPKFMRIFCHKVNIHGNKETGEDASCHGCNLHRSGCCATCRHGDLGEPGDLVGVDKQCFACHGAVLVDIVDSREITFLRLQLFHL